MAGEDRKGLAAISPKVGFLNMTNSEQIKIFTDMLKIGDKMPDFEVMDQNGNTVTSKDLLGKKTIIYFYPKDNTSGCTAEACNLRDNHEAFIAKGYNVIGVSKDSVASHKKFAEKYDFFKIKSNALTTSWT